MNENQYDQLESKAEPINEKDQHSFFNTMSCSFVTNVISNWKNLRWSQWVGDSFKSCKPLKMKCLEPSEMKATKEDKWDMAV
jgi:hypothetical protein